MYAVSIIPMKRRNLLGMVTSVFGASIAVGTGAFNTARADRKFSVEITNDTEAYLRLDPVEDTDSEGSILGRSNRPGNQIEFRFPGYIEEDEGTTAGDGVAPDSEYYFDGLVEVKNQGTNPIVVFTKSVGDINDISIYNSNDPDRELLNDKESGLKLKTGKAFEAGIYINTHGMKTGEKEGRLSFTGITVDN